MAERGRAIGRVRAAHAILGLAWEADPRRALLTCALFALNALVTSLFALWLKLLVDAVRAGDARAVTAVAAAIGVSVAGGAAVGFVSSRARMTLNDRTRHVLDRRLMALVGGARTLALHETPEHLAQLELLEQESWEFGEVIPSLVSLFDTAIRAAITAVLFAQVDARLLVLPLFALPMLLLSPRTSDLYRRGADLTAEPARRATAMFELATQPGPAKEARLFRLQGELLTRFHDAHEEVRRAQRRLYVEGEFVALAARAFFLAGYLGAIVFAAREAAAGRVTAGDVLLTAVLAGQVLGLVTWSAELLQQTLRTLTAAGRYVYLVDVAERERRPGARAGAAPARLESGIRLEHVSFGYPGTTAEVLHDVTFALPAGSTVAIVGENGAGKTTLIKLLAALYAPTAGRILVDEVDLATVDPEGWRACVAAGFQDHARFEFLVREAVGLGDLPAIDDEVAVAAALARGAAEDVLDGLPRGLGTQLGPSWPGGVELSGGQWQKLAVGRAMMRRHPLLLVLDEPAAALDPPTEHRLFDRWADAARRDAAEASTITVFVSHRLSTVLMADHIVVLGHGRVVEQGTHDELMARDGLYADLFALQARAYR